MTLRTATSALSATAGTPSRHVVASHVAPITGTVADTDTDTIEREHRWL